MSNQNGLSLIEIITVLLITSILASYAIPSFTDQLQKTTTRTETNELYHLFVFARTSAVETGRHVTLCPSTDAKTCSKDNDWAGQQLIVFTDTNLDRTVNDGEVLLHQEQAKASADSLIWKASFGRSYIQWRPDGMTNQNGTLYYCSAAKDLRYARTLIINRGGRPYFGLDRNKNGIDENGSRKDMNC